MKFSGTFTALVTPFTREGAVDEPRLRSLVERQIKAGIDGLVPVGTTGESSTLSHQEHRRVIEIVIQTARGRCPVIAGTGSNCTEEAIALSRHAERAGADGCLQVNPYYNRPTQTGLIAHFTAIAKSVKIPVILYNIPMRTGVDLLAESVKKLSSLPNLIGIKEAAGSVNRIGQLRNLCGRKFIIFSGDDSLTVPMMAVGADGVISVASNLVPREVGAMVRAARAGDFDRARKLHLWLMPLFQDLFLETNPIPIKAALAMTGLIGENYRLPLCRISGRNRIQLRRTLRQLRILV